MIQVLGFILTVLCCYASSDQVPRVGPEVLDRLRASGQDEEFARFLGIEDVSLVRAQEGRSDDFAEFTKVSPLGDILLTPEQEEQGRQGINFYRYPSYCWQNRRLCYKIEKNEFTKEQEEHIRKAIKILSDKLTYVEIVECTDDYEEDYVYIINGQGCWSRLGRNGGQQTLSLQASGCMRPGTIQHEFIHSLGMMHEHCRPDRDDYCEVQWKNIPEDWKAQYEKGVYPTFISIGKYEPNSVMHYPKEAPVSGKPAFNWTDKSLDTSRVGQRDGPTDWDIYKVDYLYYYYC